MHFRLRSERTDERMTNINGKLRVINLCNT